MPVELQVIRASEFVCLDTDEVLNFEESKAALKNLAHACRKRGLARALVDLRTLPVPSKPLFTPTQLSALIATFRNAGFSREHRLAVLYDHDVYGGVRNFAFIGRMKGMNIQTFTSFESAMQWLSEPLDDHGEH